MPSSSYCMFTVIKNGMTSPFRKKSVSKTSNSTTTLAAKATARAIAAPAKWTKQHQTFNKHELAQFMVSGSKGGIVPVPFNLPANNAIGEQPSPAEQTDENSETIFEQLGRAHDEVLDTVGKDNDQEVDNTEVIQSQPVQEIRSYRKPVTFVALTALVISVLGYFGFKHYEKKKTVQK